MLKNAEREINCFFKHEKEINNEVFAFVNTIGVKYSYQKEMSEEIYFLVLKLLIAKLTRVYFGISKEFTKEKHKELLILQEFKRNLDEDIDDVYEQTLLRILG